MAPTFYGVLGVGPDADAEAIERGYRKRVTEVHPDVNDAPDADAQFQRLTTARDTLLDADERARYDRLGHASYVRHHVSCSAWEESVAGQDPGGSGDDRSRETDESPSATTDRDPSRTDGPAGERHRRRTGASEGRTPGDGDWNAGRHRASRGNATGSGGRASSRGATGSNSNANAQSGPRTSAGGVSESRRANARRGGSSADAGGGRRRPGSGSGTDDPAARSAHATSSFWESQRVGHRFGTRSGPRVPFTVRVYRGVQALGVWVLIHLVFLAAAAGTSWYVYVVVLDASATSLPLLVVLVGEVVLAATLSSIHVLTRIYR